MWRLIHDNNKVYGLISDDNSKIHTNKTIFNGTTQEECFNKIDELKLSYTFKNQQIFINKDNGIFHK